jgi:lipid-A-disaccharide synthase
MRILISAGEASGEMYGAQLMEALLCAAARVGTAPGRPADSQSRREIAGEDAGTAHSVEFFGVGGQRMRAAGCDTLIDARDLSVVGITEILAHLPKIWGLFRKLVAEADKRKPDLAIVIDSPAFNWRVARAIHERGIPVVYYVAPQFWAWRQGRVRLLRKYVDKALVIFPFEEQFFRARGINATFVGHPLADIPRPAIEREEYAEQHQLDPEKHWITLMPGSRRKEVRMNLPTMIEAASQFGRAYEFVLPVAATLDAAFLKPLIKTQQITLVAEALPALYHSRAGIIASGTATVEAAIMGTPFVMVYRVAPLTYILGKPRVQVPHFAMVNLIAGKEIVPELVQQNFTAKNVVERLQGILPDGEAREGMIGNLAQVKAGLRGSHRDGLQAAERAAIAVLALYHSKAGHPPS